MKRWRRKHLRYVEILERRYLLSADSFGTNSLQPLDVNRDGNVSSLDALLVINRLKTEELSKLGLATLNTENASGVFPDVNGDSNVTSADALEVINSLFLSRPLVAATLPNDSAPLDRFDLQYDLRTSDYRLDLHLIGGLEKTVVEMMIGREGELVDISDHFSDGLANLSVEAVDTIFGGPLPDGDHEIWVQTSTGEKLASEIHFTLSVDRKAPTPSLSIDDALVIAPEEIKVEFSEPIDTSNFNTDDISVIGTDGNAVPFASVDLGIASVNIKFKQQLVDGDFTFHLANTVVDLAGNVAESISNAFSVNAPPRIVNINVAEGGSRLLGVSKIQLIFDEPLLSSALTESAFLLQGPDKQFVAISNLVTLESNRIIRFDISLTETGTHRFIINAPQLKDLVGNALADSPIEIEFTSDPMSEWVLSERTSQTGLSTSELSAGDFNGDGILDFATLENYSKSILILLGRGDGTFDESYTVATWKSGFNVLAVDDFDGNGVVDLIAMSASTMLVFLGKGDGTFQAPLDSVGDFHPNSIHLADINGDGIVDLGVTGLYEGFHLYLGKGDGRFIRQKTEDFYREMRPSFGKSTGLAFGDFNDDGIVDIAVEDAVTNRVGVLLGIGDGSFSEPMMFDVGLGPVSVVAGDFNNDGILDLAASNRLSHDVSILIGQGDGKFNTQQVFPVPAFPNDPGLIRRMPLSIGDFNDDGNLDLAVATEGNLAPASVLIGNGDGTFADARVISNRSSRNIFAGDLNGDGIDDLAGLDSRTISVTLGTNDGHFAQDQPFYTTTSPTPVAVLVKDFDGDGSEDFASINSDSNLVSVFFGNGDGDFDVKKSFATGTGRRPLGIISADFNGDNILDIATANYFDGAVSILLGTGGREFSEAVTLESLFTATQLTSGDFDNDGILDIATVDSFHSRVAIFYGHGNGTFAEVTSFPVGGVPVSIQAAYVNDDENLDIIVASDGREYPKPSGHVTALIGNGDGTFTGITSFDSLSQPNSVAVADFNHDGTLDVAAANSNRGLLNTSDVSIMFGDGRGKFTQQVFYEYEGPISAIVSEDLNGDGNWDLIVVNGSGSAISIRFGRIDGSFGSVESFALGSGLNSVATGDFDGDGTADFVSSHTPNGVRVTLGRLDIQ